MEWETDLSKYSLISFEIYDQRREARLVLLLGISLDCQYSDGSFLYGSRARVFSSRSYLSFTYFRLHTRCTPYPGEGTLASHKRGSCCYGVKMAVLSV